MKHLNLKTISAFFALLMIVSCSKSEQPVSELSSEESLVNIRLNGGTNTKATGVDHTSQSLANTVNTLEIFVFDNEQDSKSLDAYKKIDSSEGLDDIQIKASTGAKVIYVIANSHRDNWTDITTLSDFQAEQSLLINENINDFLMVGQQEVTLETVSTVDISISRLVAQVVLSGVKTTFTGSLFEGKSLTNVKAYLINVQGSKGLDSSAVVTPTILNSAALNSTDVNNCEMSGIIYDQIPVEITDSGYATPHYFYTYGNSLETETEIDKYTRLVIQGDLNGETYYYPININQEGFGYVESNGHKGIKGNTTYTISVNITRLGSKDPDEVIDYKSFECVVSIENWDITNAASAEF